jgi:hypothetical protein
VFPGFFLIGKTVMTETFFIVILGITSLILHRAVLKPSLVNFFFLGFNSYLLFMIRGNGIIVIFVFSVLMAYFSFAKYRRFVTAFIVGILPLFLLDFVLRKYFFTTSEPVLLRHGNEMFRNLSNFEWIRNFFGNLTFVYFSTLFLVPIFLVNFFSKIKKIVNLVDIVFISIFFINVLVISLMMLGGYRADHHFYGRYMEAFLLPIFLPSINVYFSENFKFNHKEICSFIGGFCLFTVFLMYGSFFF